MGSTDDDFTEFRPIGTIDGQAVHARLRRFDELGCPHCDYAVLGDVPTTYTLGLDSNGLEIYRSECEPGVSFTPAYNGGEPRPARIEVYQGWWILPGRFADGSANVFEKGGPSFCQWAPAPQSTRRPPKPVIKSPEAIAALEEIRSRFLATIPSPGPAYDLYRACEGDNPSLLRGEPI